MSASTSSVDRRSFPTVAIVGNDAVLVAAPATPVQLSHACLRRGFTVAVPASWGDELVAAEALRHLTAREKGPAVMCVCPFARSRLLASGSDLEPFLVSLVSPPVATARYLRSVYGERGVHITYIGGCPSADDPVIDARLTPDAFLADLAENGIALSEQPLVFESIVPPDRRRWCSLPGGVPSVEMLGSDTETRTLVEIERDDISTDLAQHIIAREHVLLDLAPSLGCACSGAIGSSPLRNARLAVAALEPPRALGPVIDPNVGVSLAMSPPMSPTEPATAPVGVSDDRLLEMRLDAMLGTEVRHRHVVGDFGAELEAEPDADLAEVLAGGHVVAAFRDGGALLTETAPVSTATDTLERRDDAPAIEVPAIEARTIERTSAIEPSAYSTNAPGNEVERDISASVEPVPAPTVRRRTPQGMIARYPAGSIPKATDIHGRALPRAYVAKRRTPSMDVPSIGSGTRESITQVRGVLATAVVPTTDVHPEPVAADEGVVDTTPISAPSVVDTDDRAVAVVESPASDEGVAPERSSPPSTPSNSGIANSTLPLDSQDAPEPSASGAAAATPASNHGALQILLVAVLLGFALIVLFTLRR